LWSKDDAPTTERRMIMEVANGKIVVIDEDELFDLYLKRGMDDIYSFPDYVKMFEAAGTLVLSGKVEGNE
jgi:hypothetical protein